MSRFWNALPITVAVAALGVAGYQQLAMRRLERQVAVLFSADARTPGAVELDQRFGKLDARLVRLAAQCQDRGAAPAGPAAAPAAPEPAALPPGRAPEDKPVSVQQQLSTREGRAQWLADLAEAAHLSTKQTGSLGPILQGEADRRERILERQRAGAPPAEVFNDLRQLRRDTDRQFRSLLDDDQFQAYLRRRLAPVTATTL
jgi:hypothetical protein